VYRLLYSLVFKRIDAETAHRLGFRLLRFAAFVPGGQWLMRRVFRVPGPAVKALGLDFPSPLGLAAGFDKNGTGVAALAALGFGFVEVGTVTARPQPGNPRPRLFRFPASRALVNRMGFNNDGAVVIASRLRRLGPQHPIIGVNIGKSKAASPDEAIADYVFSARAVADVADYVVVNVSSPNTPGLRDLQAVSKLGPLLAAVRSELDSASPRRRVPLLVKIAPDLADADIDAVADLALSLGLDGIIATNTTISRAGLPAGTDVGAGGMSGAPLKPRALEVLRRLHDRTDDKLVLIAVGGISTPADARERLDAGATLIQAYTAFIYDGPFWPKRINASLRG
jgi:dihydroorotate dehydrogenase